MASFNFVTVTGKDVAPAAIGFQTVEATPGIFTIGAELTGTSAGIVGICRLNGGTGPGVHGLGMTAGVRGDGQNTSAPGVLGLGFSNLSPNAAGQAGPGVQGVGGRGVGAQGVSQAEPSAPGVVGIGGAAAAESPTSRIPAAAGVLGVAGDAPDTSAPFGQERSYGGVFAAFSQAQLRLVPLPSLQPDPTGNVPGTAGDLLVTQNDARTASLWFCQRTGDQATAVWHQIA